MSLPVLKKNLYQNCHARDRDGDIIFYCSSKRAYWYINRNLAVILNEDPLEIQLTFETKGKGNFGDNFYLQARKNICTCCGTTEVLTRHHIVPICFRRHLPNGLKDNSYHDILLLCLPCHEAYESHALTLKRELAEEYDAPVDGVWIGKELHTGKVKAKHIAKTIIKYADSIPAERKEYLITKIKEYLSVDIVSLEEVADMNIESPVIKTQDEIIISKITDIDSFIRRWRQHFVDVMSPKFLPSFWSITRNKR